VTDQGSSPVPGLDRLDGEAGPARALPSNEQQRRAGAVVLELRRRKRARAFRAVAAAAVVLLAVSVASAVVWEYHRSVPDESSRPAAPEAPTATPRAVLDDVAEDGGAEAAIVKAPNTGARSEGRVAPDGSAASSHEAVLPSELTPRGRGDAGSTEDAHRDRMPAQVAKDWLARANELRQARRWKRAHATYLHVARSAPGSHEAYVAAVAAASLRLHQLGQPRGALRLYRQAIARRPAGALTEEARYGVAEAYRAVGNESAEVQALQSFVASHPGSPLRRAADARLDALRAR
jgi:tetratricopeptide (TPR) repeat protein